MPFGEKLATLAECCHDLYLRAKGMENLAISISNKKTVSAFLYQPPKHTQKQKQKLSHLVL